MESLKLSFMSVAPIFILMLLGYILRCIKLVDKKTLDAVNKLIFKAFLPTLLFYNVYTTKTENFMNTPLITFTIVAVLCVFVVGLLVVQLLTKDASKRGVMLQGFFRSNFAILGIPLMDYMCGIESSSLASLMVAVIIPVFNILAVVSLELFRGGKVRIFKVLFGVITNPLIIGCALGYVFYRFGIKLPAVLETAVRDISKIASPLSIIVLGGSFTFSSIRGYVKDIFSVVFARLVFVPVIVLTIAAVLGFRGEAFACLIVAFGSPVAVSSFAMAQQMGGDEKLAGQVVVISSALCLFSLFGIIFVSSNFGII